MENNVTKEQTSADNIVIDRRRFIKLLNKLCKTEYMLALVSAICYAAKVEYLLTPQDVCELLEIDYTKFEKELRKHCPKSTAWSGGRVYSLESMATIAEITTRPQRLKKLSPPPNK